ncbi:MAG TPA: baseplate J/gp47 family protein [Rhizomicrobium sp.]|nr:baseplate J/gp47 family protein [Rhizomicrobium sp.]
MPFQRPTLSDLRLRARALFASKLKGADGTLPKSNITVTSDVIAALVYGLYGYADWLARQALPNTADDWYYLSRWGALFGLSPKPPVQSAGNALFTGSVNASVPHHTLLQDSLGNQYKTTADATLIAGATSVPIISLVGGAMGNLPAGAPLTLLAVLTNVDGTASVDGSGLSDGLDAETTQDFGARIAQRMKNSPSGSGTLADYQRWALSVPGVTRATANPLEHGAGTITIRFVMDANPNGFIPRSGDIDTVKAVIVAEAPVTDQVTVVAPTPQPVNYTLSPSVPTNVRPAIAQALAAMHKGLAIGAGLSVQAQIIPAIGAAGNIKAKFLSQPLMDIPPNPALVLTLGTIAYQ